VWPAQESIGDPTGFGDLVCVDGHGVRACARSDFHFTQWIHQAMSQAAVSRVLIGPYGLHAFGITFLVLFAVFLWAFNFTNFF
jgi:hypothetical protein